MNGYRFRLTRRRALLLTMVALLVLAWWVDVPAQWCRLAACRSLRNNQPQAAMTWIQRCRSIGGSNGELLLLEARTYTRAGLTAQAMQSLAAASRRDGVDGEMLRACTDLVLAWRGDLSAGERLSTLRSDILPPCEVYEAVVRCALFHGRWDWGRSVLDSWEKDHPRDAAVPYLRGRVFELLEEPTEALGEYDAALRLQASLAKAAFRKGMILRDQRRFDEAAAALLRCRESPFESIAMIELANCYWQQGKNDAAWESLEPYVELPPQQSMELYLQVEEFVGEDRAALIAARIRDSQNDPEATIPLLERVLDFNHRNVEARNLLASALRRLGRDQEAEQQTAIVQELLAKRKQIDALGRLLYEKPDDLEMRCDLAELNLEAESLMVAQLELIEILKKSPDFARAHRLLARVYREKARFAAEFSHSADYHDRLGQ